MVSNGTSFRGWRMVNRQVTKFKPSRLPCRSERGDFLVPLPLKCFAWPAPWRRLDHSEISNDVIAGHDCAELAVDFTFFEAELRREVPAGHLLHGVECRAVARSRDHPDEFIFATNRPGMPVAFVHLTWAVESNPAFPYTVGYPSWVAFQEAWETD